MGFCFVKRSYGGGRRGQEKGLNLLQVNSRRRADEVKFLSGEGCGQKVAACHIKEVRDQCRVWGGPVN